MSVHDDVKQMTATVALLQEKFNTAMARMDDLEKKMAKAGDTSSIDEKFDSFKEELISVKRTISGMKGAAAKKESSSSSR